MMLKTEPKNVRSLTKLFDFSISLIIYDPLFFHFVGSLRFQNKMVKKSYW